MTHTEILWDLNVIRVGVKTLVLLLHFDCQLEVEIEFVNGLVLLGIIVDFEVEAFEIIFLQFAVDYADNAFDGVFVLLIRRGLRSSHQRLLHLKLGLVLVVHLAYQIWELNVSVVEICVTVHLISIIKSGLNF